ncbi:MAG: deoxyguanosinetriphosphate triphosphohydrolase, partial [Bifidobacteriaceae bacterium]|nr:deoxyguanosinetriphosphate triphosphohydrolase [Bifidobacteriaceae bacterium]
MSTKWDPRSGDPPPAPPYALGPGPIDPGPYAPADRERWVDEEPKSSSRTPFDRARARVLHSAALRRLGAKTQVKTPWRRSDFPAADDFIRTRLTHSLEVAQVGRELGKMLGLDPDVVDTACLAHDLGHPPFGHNGEQALAQVSADIGGFEGNAQTLRLLTRLEAKIYGSHLGRSVGLNLTRASLDAVCKYPWPRGEAPAGIDATKFGFYDVDADSFAWLRAGAPPGRRCVEAQVMDFSDDVAYSVHDVEDGIVGGGIAVSALADDGERRLLAQMAASRYVRGWDEAELIAAAGRLGGLEYWPTTWDGSRAGLAGLKDMTSQLIGRFCTAATGATRARHGGGRMVRYGADLVVPRETLGEIAILKALAAVYVMEPRRDDPIYVAQRELLAELYEHLVDIAPFGLDAEYRGDWRSASSDAERRRVVVAQIAALTD